MAYVPRLTAPTRYDSKWVSTDYGGLNRCIPILGNGWVLPNCFTGDTEILTLKGVYSLASLLGQNVIVPTVDGCWHEARVLYFGNQAIWEVHTSGGKMFRCTGSHRWYVRSSESEQYYWLETWQLHIGLQIPFFNSDRTDYILYVKPKNYYDDVYCAVEPVTHSFTLGCGALTGNCTGYAWGRWLELLGTTPKLSTGDAGQWYGHTSDGYKRGRTPQLGAIACYGESGSWGHVAVVEAINSDGSITCGQSGYDNYMGVDFWTETWYPPNYIDWGGGYYFQGFIYCPSTAGIEDKLSLFLKEAESHVGEGGDWAWSKSGLGRGQHWCAAFVVACGLAVGGIIGVIIPHVFGAGDMPRRGCPTKTSQQLGGRWIRGPYYGTAAGTPQPGDLILFRWNRYSNPPDEYYSDHVGIVTSVSGGVVYTVEGNTDGSSPWNSTVTKNDYSLSDGRINGYYRPDWAKVGASVNNLLTGIGGNLYDMVNTREDAIIREVGFMQGTEPSIKISNTRLSVINYTTLLGQFFQGSIFSGVYGSGVAIDASAINNTVCRAIIEYLTGKGFNAATACGIAGNMQQEMGSSWDIGQTVVDSDGGLAGGICMWNDTYGNLSRMIKYVGSNWRNNLTGQLDYLWYDMTVGQTSWFKLLVQNNYGVNETIVNMLMKCPNTEAGVRQAADIFLRCYENAGDQDNQSRIRGNNGVAIWNSLVNQLV